MQVKSLNMVWGMKQTRFVLSQVKYFYVGHGAIRRTRIACKKILDYMRGSACGMFVVKKAKIFRIYVKYF